MRKYLIQVMTQIMSEDIKLIIVPLVLWTFCFWWWVSPQNIYNTESYEI